MVATSTNLRSWNVVDKPILTVEDIQKEYGLGSKANIYPNSALVTHEGKIALLYALQDYPKWIGFFLATADNPLGPFVNYQFNPVYNFGRAAHEFDCVRIDEGYSYKGKSYRYLLFFAGKSPNGDRGYMLYSNDLKTWVEDKDNPVFHPQTTDNWDGRLIRPRSLNKIGDTWYLWYEGCNRWQPPNSRNRWCDTVGLARSKDLHQWEHYPRNPALPGLGRGGFDSGWVGWPRMWVENGIGYVFYTGGGLTGMRTIAIDQLTNWESEGGETTSLYKPHPKNKTTFFLTKY